MAEEPIQKLVHLLIEGDGQQRASAANQLATIGQQDVKVTPLVAELLKHEDRLTRYYAASVLGRIGPGAAEAVPLLRNILIKNNELDVDRSMAANALGLIGPAGLPALKAALKDRESLVRRHATSALRLLADTPSSNKAISLLIELLGDSDEDVRAAALESLQECFGVVALPRLRKALTHRTTIVQVSVARIVLSLDRTHHESLEILINGLKHKDNIVRITAAWGLLSLGHEEKPAVPALTKALEDVNHEVREGVVRALLDMGTDAQPAVLALGKRLFDSEERVRWYAAKALCKMGPTAKDAIPSLIKAIKDESYPVRVCVHQALGEIGPAAKAAIPTLLEVTPADNPYYTEEVSKALERIRGYVPD